jgi:hypothetical protein
MKDALNYQHVDMVLTLFYDRLPFGANYIMLTYRLDFEIDEWDTIFDFLVEEFLIEEWGENDQYILTEKGQSVITKYCGIQNYLKTWAKMKS